MTKAKTPALSEKDRRAQALQKALRDNLRRRKAATAVEAGEGNPESENQPLRTEEQKGLKHE